MEKKIAKFWFMVQLSLTLWAQEKKKRKKKKNFGAVTALVIVNWMTSMRELLQRRQNKQNLILKYKELYHMCVRSWYFLGVPWRVLSLYRPYTSLYLPYTTEYTDCLRPKEGSVYRVFYTVQRPSRIDFAIARSMQQGLSLRSSRSDLTLIYLDVTIHLRAGEGKKSRDKSLIFNCFPIYQQK